MRKIILTLMILNSIIIHSQISMDGLPHGFGLKLNLKSAQTIPVYNLVMLKKEKVLLEDSMQAIPLKYSIFEEVSIDIKKGLNTKLVDGQLWQYKLRGTGAVSLQIIFSKFVIPEGAKLYIYDEQMKHFIGAFTNKNMQKDSSFIVADFYGDSLIVEYFEPPNSLISGKLIIGSVGKAFLDIHSSEIRSLYVGINCPEGKDWQYQKHSTCMITFKFAGSGYLCSGSLINNVNKDGIPYFLTASHCIHDSITARTMVTYFNYDEIQCSSKVIQRKTLSGSTLLSTGPWSDYSLLKLDTTPPPDYQPYYAGWDRSQTIGKSTVCINHPRGNPKKIAFDYKPPIIVPAFLTWDEGLSSPAYSHWAVNFTDGTVQPGSSGSPLFDENKRIIGQLHGSDIGSEYFGMFSYSWTHNSSVYKPLQYFLDPYNTGLTKIDGYFPSSNVPDPEFYQAFPQVCFSTPIKLKNNSVFNSIFWKWRFTPDTITYVNNTDSTSENPVVTFNKLGYYKIELLEGNVFGNDSIVADSSIIASNDLNVKVKSAVPDGLCLNEFDSILFIAKGASDYEWNFISGSGNYFYFSKFSNDSSFIKKNSTAVFDSTISISIYVTGRNGSCSASDSIIYSLIKPSNDNVEFATQIFYGHNGPFTNQCAMIQSGEPSPPYISCMSQDSWCDQSLDNNNHVQHSVWFKIIAETDQLFISTNGIDSRIALYDALSSINLLNGNYVILAANDDVSSSNFNSVLNNVPVVVGKLYWLQVDVSRGRVGGSFYINISDYNDIATSKIKYDNISVYPQPVSKDFVVQNDALIATNLQIIVYSATGTIVSYSKYYHNLKNFIGVKDDNWKSGFYVIRILADDKVLSAKILKK
jgi:Trypsin-like peptidase domain